MLAKEIIGRYPKARSATIPLLHLAQQQDGYVTNEAMAHIAELVGATSAEVLGTAHVLRDVQVRAGRQVPDQHLRHDVVHAAGRRGTDAPRRAHAGHQGRQHHRRRAVHARARRVPGGVHRGAVPAGQLPLPLPGHARRVRSVDRRSRRRSPRRRDPAARHVGPRAPAASRPTVRSAPSRPTTSTTPPVWMPPPAAR